MNIRDEEHYYDFARDLGLKGYDLFALPYFSHKLINALPPKKEMTKEEIFDSMTDVMRYLTSSGQNKMDSYLNVEGTQAKLEELENQVTKHERKIRELRESASRLSTFKLLLGSGIPIAQFMLIFYGTFETHCWDIMEPVCYLMTLGNFTAGFAFYLKNHKDLELSSVHELITERTVRKRAATFGIDVDEHEDRKVELAEMKGMLNTRKIIKL